MLLGVGNSGEAFERRVSADMDYEDEELHADEDDFYSDEKEDYDDENVGEDQEIVEEDTWDIVSAYFEEKGLVRQQLNSFNVFVEHTMQVLRL